jgi:hypothetical protein
MATQPSHGVAFSKNGEALSRATSGMSVANYPTICGGFIQKKKASQSPKLSHERTSSLITLGQP